jgi:hypothetical protein
MGGVSSRELIQGNENIRMLVGTQPVAFEDMFWKNLFTFRQKLSELNAYELQVMGAEMCKQMGTFPGFSHSRT